MNNFKFYYVILLCFMFDTVDFKYILWSSLHYYMEYILSYLIRLLKNRIDRQLTLP